MSDITLTKDRYSVIKEYINDIRKRALCLEKELEGLSPPKDSKQNSLCLG